MNLKTSITCLGALAIVAQCTMSLSVCGAMPSALPGITQGGGQAPPGASGGSGVFTVVVATKLSKQTADTLRDELVQEEFPAAESRPAADGTYEVAVGGIRSRGAAETLMGKLKSSGYTPDGIVENGVPTTETAASVFRVQVAEFASAAEAAEASKILADEGFVNVDVVQDNGRHVLMLGTFNRKADADALLTQVSEAGFALASVVNRDRLLNTAVAPTDADLSGLSASEQEQTRNVLAMAGKVESGEASAEELTQLRETIQRLPENQKAIVERQESSRSATRGNMQQIFTLYRDFERSMANRDFASAERTLGEVRQIDPNDIYLASRAQALERARTGADASTNANAPAPPVANAVDPAQVQQLLNEGRALESSNKTDEALQKYRQALTMDPTNTEARGKVASLGDSTEPASADDAGALAGIMENKPLLYGAAGVAALIIISLLWMKLRGRRADAGVTTPSSSLSSGPDFIDPLAPSGGYNDSPTPTPLGSTGLPTEPEPTYNSSPATTGAGMAGAGMAGAGMTDFAMMDDGEEDEEPVNKTPTPVPQLVSDENDMVSFEEFESAPDVAAVPPAATAPPQSDDDISLNLENDPSPSPAAAPVSDPTPAKGSSSMDADLEALLKGTFAGAPAESADVPENLEPALAAVGAAAASESSAPERLIYQQNFDGESEGASPAEWRGEYDYSTLSVASLGEADHGQCLKFEKPEGVGSATYHLSFPPAKNHVLVEFDIRCEEKNKFLLGIYLEKDEDFKQSVHTIVHQLDPNGPASLRIQGQAIPYQMETWRRIRYEIDLVDGILNAFIDDEQVLTDSRLAVTPDYFNTLSIRDNLATTGIIYLDNIRISEA